MIGSQGLFSLMVLVSSSVSVVLARPEPPFASIWKSMKSPVEILSSLSSRPWKQQRIHILYIFCWLSAVVLAIESSGCRTDNDLLS